MPPRARSARKFRGGDSGDAERGIEAAAHGYAFSVSRVEDAPPGPPPPPDARPGPPPRPPWRREWLILLALLALAGLGLVAWLVLRDSGDEDRTTMPNVVGLQQQLAEERVREAGLEPNVEGESSDRPEGTVISQDPGAGTGLDEGEEVVLAVSRGDETTTVTETETVTTETEGETETETQPTAAVMPDMVGQPYPGAVLGLVGSGLLVNSFPVESEEVRGTVVAQRPAPQTPVDSDDVVRINIAIGPDPRGTVSVPDVTGPLAADALGACAQAEVTCLIEFTSAPQPENVDEVVDQEPAAGTRVPRLDQVTLFVGR